MINTSILTFQQLLCLPHLVGHTTTETRQIIIQSHFIQPLHIIVLLLIYILHRPHFLVFY